MSDKLELYLISELSAEWFVWMRSDAFDKAFTTDIETGMKIGRNNETETLIAISLDNATFIITPSMYGKTYTISINLNNGGYLLEEIQ